MILNIQKIFNTFIIIQLICLNNIIMYFNYYQNNHFKFNNENKKYILITKILFKYLKSLSLNKKFFTHMHLIIKSLINQRINI